MLVINATKEQKQVFNKLIEDMQARVVWNGRFIIMGDRLILEGLVQSLFFHLDIQKAEAELADLPEDGEELEMADYPGLEDLITMAVYAFHAFGVIRGIHAEWDIAQLEEKFREILRAYQLDCAFSEEKMEFYRQGMRITYEDVLEAALALPQTQIQVPVLKLPSAEAPVPEQAAAGVHESTQGQAGRNSQAAAERIEKYHARIGVLDRLSDLQRKALVRDIRGDKLLSEEEKEELYAPIRDFESMQQDALEQAVLARYSRDAASDTNAEAAGQTKAPAQNAAAQESAGRNSQAAAERMEKYRARIGVLDRLSDLQRKTLLRDIRNDRLLTEAEKESLYYPIQDYEYQELMQKAEEELKDSENRTFAHVCQMIERIEKEDLFEKTKEAVLETLRDLSAQYGAQEVHQIMEHVPQHVERSEYQELMEKLAPYRSIDLSAYQVSAYQEQLRRMRETLEIKEISNMLMNSPKKNRRDYMKLLRRIEEQGFAKENAAPYIERILDWVSELDTARLKELLAGVQSMDFDAAALAYETIRTESFLPGLRESALSAVSRRLEEIRLAECRQLVQALRKNMEGVIKENPRHHFYPAADILSKTAVPEDTRLIDNAVSAYAEHRGRFEYPLFMADTSKEGNGRDGMLLTPEHLFYSSRMNGYRIDVSAVKSVYISSGLLNHRVLTAEEENGVRHKLPYAVEPDEMKNWAKVLDLYIRFLKKRAVSGRLSSESAQEQEEMSCRRCGCVYQEKGACPECGYPGA
ncbi:MAG: hypothetical protein HFH32_02210 [Eubacterium sp.]|nr:hypothetical protein [Eubacterium sp.]